MVSDSARPGKKSRAMMCWSAAVYLSSSMTFDGRLIFFAGGGGGISAVAAERFVSASELLLVILLNSAPLQAIHTFMRSGRCSHESSESIISLDMWIVVEVCSTVRALKTGSVQGDPIFELH